MTFLVEWNFSGADATGPRSSPRTLFSLIFEPYAIVKEVNASSIKTVLKVKGFIMDMLGYLYIE